jgi:hypothetical protein
MTTMTTTTVWVKPLMDADDRDRFGVMTQTAPFTVHHHLRTGDVDRLSTVCPSRPKFGRREIQSLLTCPV